MKLLKLNGILALMALIIFGLASCSKDDTTTSPTVTAPNTPAVVTNLEATSISATEVAIKWNASKDQSDTAFKNFTGYEVIITGSNISPSDTTYNWTSGDMFSVTIGGLTEGIEYTFTIKAVASNSAGKKTSDPTTVKWSPASRFNDIKLYETASSYASGLQLFDGTEPATLNVSEAAKRPKIDIIFNSSNNSNDIGSPTLLSTKDNLKTTWVDRKDSYVGITDLDQLFDTELFLPTVPQSYNFNDTHDPFVFTVKTAEGNYAKVLVRKDNNTFLQGTSPDRYVLLNVSYQTTANVPYAISMGHPSKSNGSINKNAQITTGSFTVKSNNSSK